MFKNISKLIMSHGRGGTGKFVFVGGMAGTNTQNSEFTLSGSYMDNEVNLGGNGLISPLAATKLTLDVSTDTVQVLGSATIGGNLTVGLLTINDMDASINSMGETLKLQSLGLADIEFMGGKVVMTKEGDIKISGDLTVSGNVSVAGDITSQGEITAEKATAEEFKVLGAKSAGSAVLQAGDLTLSVSAEAAAPESRVLITPTSKTGAVLAVTEKALGRFTVEAALPQPEDISFDWFIVGN